MNQLSESQNYVELRPFNPPIGLHHQSIDPTILKGFGLDPTTPQSHLLLAQVALFAEKTENSSEVPDGWYVAAMDALEPKVETSFGGIRIDDLSLSPRAILARADEWIRDSEVTEWVPGSVMELRADEGAVSAHGVILVRALRSDEEVTNVVETPTENRRPRWLRWLP